ncbi:MAG: homoserine dehydrogenase, partial [Lachnospiraceae bacterium]|nr:homoserine dehydrogenase [Lachnospiraceae bacterium]
MTKVAILGYGTVGSGVYEVLKKNKEVITNKLGNEIQVKYVLDLREFEGDPVQEVLVHDVDTIINDAEVAVICETMGGEHPAYEFTRRALESGKSVCTSNKELVEKHGPELIQIAKEHKCSYMFEASVGGGIPIIRPLRTSLAQEEILSITGILNG